MTLYERLKNSTDLKEELFIIRKEYNGTVDGFNKKLDDLLTKLQSDYDFKYYEQLNNLWMQYNIDENPAFLDQIEIHKQTKENSFLRELREAIDNETRIIDIDPKPRKHVEIFKGNNFDIWQRMFDAFQITESKRTDLDFMFQVMKYNGLIHKNIKPIDMQNWINETYQIAVEKLKYTDIKSDANKKRMAVFNSIK